MAKGGHGNTAKEHSMQCSRCYHCKAKDNCCELTGLYVPGMRQRLPDFDCRSFNKAEKEVLATPLWAWILMFIMSVLVAAFSVAVCY